MKERDVIIQIKGKQRYQEGQQDEIDLFTVGKLEKQSDSYVLSYLDNDEDFPDGVKTIVSIGPRTVTILREPFPKSLMTVQEAQRHLCHYETGYGSMTVGVFGEKITSSIGENGGELSMKYTIDINSALASENELHISVREA